MRCACEGGGAGAGVEGLTHHSQILGSYSVDNNEGGHCIDLSRKETECFSLLQRLF